MSEKVFFIFIAILISIIFLAKTYTYVTSTKGYTVIIIPFSLNKLCAFALGVFITGLILILVVLLTLYVYIILWIIYDIIK